MATHAGGEQGGPTTRRGSTVPGRTATASAASHHGSSVAAWTMVLILMLGSLVASVGVAAASVTLVVIGAVIIVVGLVVGKVLSLAGYGTVKPVDPEAPHGVA